jgi:hypothetical protein
MKSNAKLYLYQACLCLIARQEGVGLCSFSVFSKPRNNRKEKTIEKQKMIMHLDFTMTHTRYGRSLWNMNGQLTKTRRSDGAPEPDGVIKVVAGKKILHYHQLYIDRPDPITFMSVVVDTSVRIYDDFLRLLFLHVHREVSTLANDIPEESVHFRFFRTVCLSNIKGSVGLILSKTSDMRISIPFDLSSRPFIPPPHFRRSRRSTILLTPG